MRILITNDDGINAPGLAVLQAIAEEVAGPDGEVWTVAPPTERSGVAHCINYAYPSLLTQLDDRRYTVDGYPADCVLAGVHHVMKDAPPDLVLSGVNRGNNAGENVAYSGTIGAAMEGALQGLLSIALSQFYGPDTDHSDPFGPSAKFGADVVRKLINADEERPGYRLFYNVNFPPCPADQVKGTRVVAQGFRPDTRHRVEPHLSPSRRTFLWVNGGPQSVDTGPDTDVTANVEGYISVTPLSADMTVRSALPTLKEAMEG